MSAEPITDVDATAADALGELLDDLDQRGVELGFAELKGPVRDRLEPYGIVDRIGRQHFYRTVGEAVKSYVADTGTPWVDWDDEGKDEPRE